MDESTHCKQDSKNIIDKSPHKVSDDTMENALERSMRIKIPDRDGQTASAALCVISVPSLVLRYLPG